MSRNREPYYAFEFEGDATISFVREGETVAVPEPGGSAAARERDAAMTQTANLHKGPSTSLVAGPLCKMRQIKLERIRFRGHAPTKPLGFTSKDIVADTASRCQ